MTPAHRFLHSLSLAILSLLLSGRTRAQAPAPTVPTPAYDVVSIVPSKEGATYEMGVESHEATLTATNADLTNLLINAFDIKPDLIFGLPPWAGSTHWTLQAKILDPDLAVLKKLTNDQRRAMLAQVLADRFQLKAHIETRQLPVYNLVVGPRGPKFKPSPRQGPEDMVGMSSGDGEVTLEGYPLAALAYTLSSMLHRTVLDKTGLSAHYDLHLTWAPERAVTGQDDGRGIPDSGPSIFSAVRDQLGLKLEPGRGAVPTLVIDHVALPTPN